MSDLLSLNDELTVSFENPAGDAMGYNSVEGKVICERDQVVLQFKQRDRAFRKNPIHTVSLEYSELEKIEFVSRWLRPKELVIQTSEAEKLRDFPGGGVGVVTLRLKKESIADAKRMESFVEYKQSEARLAESDRRFGSEEEV